MKNNYHEAMAVFPKKNLVFRLFLLILIFGVFLAGCGEAHVESDSTRPTEHVHNWDYSVEGQYHATEWMELESVMKEDKNGDIYEIYVYSYFRKVDGWEYGYDSYRYKVFLVTETGIETQEFYDDYTLLDYINEGIPRLERLQKVKCYCVDCDTYEYMNYTYDRDRICVPKGTVFIVE